ncbi:MAG: hypothetical protein O3A86_06000 [Bacteroidetes bacterium]|nr:hypothetical protein [Bacteroidota bacterium]
MIRTIVLMMGCWVGLLKAQDNWEPRQTVIDLQETLGLGESDWQLRSSWGRGAAAPVHAVGTAWAQSTRVYWKGKEASASLALQTDAFEKGLDYIGFSAHAKKWFVGDMQLFIGQGLVWGQGQPAFGGLQPIRLEMHPQLLQTYRGVRENYAIRGVGYTSQKGPCEWGCILGRRKWDARWEGGELKSIDRSGEHQTPLSLERKRNLGQQSLIAFGSYNWIRNGNAHLPHWKMGTALGLSRFSTEHQLPNPWMMASSLWASGPLGMGTVSIEWAKEGFEAPRTIVKYSQALSKWADWGLEFSRRSSSEKPQIGLDSDEDLPEGSSGKLLFLCGPNWSRWQWASQWRLPVETMVTAQWEHRLSQGGEKRKAAAGQLSAGKWEWRASGQAAEVLIQCRAQLRWALPSSLHNRFFQIKAQVSQLTGNKPSTIDFANSHHEPSAQLNGTLKWGKQSLGVVLFRGSSLQWASLPSLPYQSSWRPVSGNGLCVSAACRWPLGQKVELQWQFLYQSPSTSEASMLRMFAQVQWKA